MLCFSLLSCIRLVQNKFIIDFFHNLIFWDRPRIAIMYWIHYFYVGMYSIFKKIFFCQQNKTNQCFIVKICCMYWKNITAYCTSCITLPCWCAVVCMSAHISTLRAAMLSGLLGPTKDQPKKRRARCLCTIQKTDYLYTIVFALSYLSHRYCYAKTHIVADYELCFTSTRQASHHPFLEMQPNGIAVMNETCVVHRIRRIYDHSYYFFHSWTMGKTCIGESGAIHAFVQHLFELFYLYYIIFIF